MGRPKGSGSKNKKSIPLKMICQSPTCEKAGVEQPIGSFYNTNSTILPKYPVCKKCLQKLININDMQTIYKVLKEMDIPFIQSIWEIALEKEPNNPFGKLITMTNSLPQYRGMKWCDSVFEKQNNNEKRNENGTIYSLEWCGTYSEKDLKYLDDYLESLQKDFKIVTRNHIDYARKIAKASLAMDKAYEDMLTSGSESKYKTLKEIFDTLSKSAQFAESQRGINDVSLGNFGVVFDKVEKHMWVPPYCPKEPDIYDKLIDQFSNINKSL
jgi:hypothetical protein